MFRKFSRTNTPNRSKIVQNVVKCFITCHDLKKKKKSLSNWNFHASFRMNVRRFFFLSPPKRIARKKKEKKKKKEEKKWLEAVQ